MIKYKFKTLEECVELHKQGVESNIDGYDYTFCCEETEIDEFDINGDIESQLEDITDAGGYGVEGDYDEFTRVICPAYIEVVE